MRQPGRPDMPRSMAISAGHGIPFEIRAISLTALNQAYGRKFQILSFRWLSPGDI
jgi:hypothetical protein